MPAEIRAARSANRLEFERIALEFMMLPCDELKARLKDPKITALEHIVARLLADAGTGDPRSFDTLMNRLFGRTRAEPVPAEEKPTLSFVELVMKAEAAKKSRQP